MAENRQALRQRRSTSRQLAAEDAHNYRPRDFLRPVLLLLLAERPTYGYDLAEQLRYFGLDQDPGGMYRALHSLERDGLVRSRTKSSDIGPTQRIYFVTRRGHRWLDDAAWALGATRMDVVRFLHRHAMLRALPQPKRTVARPSPLSEALVRLEFRLRRGLSGPQADAPSSRPRIVGGSSISASGNT